MTKFASYALTVPGRVDVTGWHGKSAPARRWVVDELLPDRNVTILGGDGGLGKSVLALQLLAACVLGKPDAPLGWLGRQARPCSAVGVFCEDDEEEIWRRLERVAAHYGAEVSDLSEGLRLFARPSLDNALMVWKDQYGVGETTTLFNQLSNVAIDGGAELVVFDSLHDLFTGNENNRAHARQFIAELRGLAMHIEGAVMVTAHPSLAGRNTGTGEAGSTAWNNAVRSRLYLTASQLDDAAPADGPGDYRELKTMKSNYAAAGGRIKLHWRDGVFVADQPSAGGVIGAIERRTVETAFLEALDAARNQGRAISSSPGSPDYGPKIFTRMPQARGYRRAELEAAMNSLFAAGAIRNDEVGKLANRMPRMGIVRTVREGGAADAA
jgi:RecA-family ATPase